MPFIDVHAHPAIGARNQVDPAMRRGVESANALTLFPRFKNDIRATNRVP